MPPAMHRLRRAGEYAANLRHQNNGQQSSSYGDSDDPAASVAAAATSTIQRAPPSFQIAAWRATQAAQRPWRTVASRLLLRRSLLVAHPKRPAVTAHATVASLPLGWWLLNHVGW
ncbi:MAG: hypothetical protein EOO41_05450 [Methanobacteriota archaeon]|nr:MAG: hypothetical protein EOO41_05450 [Euryarchaeota archaeon]